MKWLREWWRILVEFLKWRIEQEYPFVEQLDENSDKAAMYERLEKHYPNILARLNAAAEKKERR
ncbi:MAG: hypothetical protein K2M79_07135 [Muribaculaceae bacterium]|nr:hypothetical protein [Muribaculaceae bacterium]